eukprot:356565-Chlamydomonas_euryale.AAC.14
MEGIWDRKRGGRCLRGARGIGCSAKGWATGGLGLEACEEQHQRTRACTPTLRRGCICCALHNPERLMLKVLMLLCFSHPELSLAYACPGASVEPLDMFMTCDVLLSRGPWTCL